MRRKILYLFVGLILLVVFLLRSGLVLVEISPYFYYKLDKTETQIIEDVLFKFREKVETEKFNEVKSELASGTRSKNEIIEEIKKNREKFGKPVSSELFRSSPPESVSKYYENLEGKLYTTFYFTKTEKGEFFEDISWIVDDNNEPRLLNYSGSKIVEWQIKSREKEEYIKANYHNKIQIPFGNRFIEINY